MLRWSVQKRGIIGSTILTGAFAVAVEQLPGPVHSGGLGEILGNFMPTDEAARTIRNQAWLDAVATEIHELLGSLYNDLRTNSDSK